jgi:hypothetical protein
MTLAQIITRYDANAAPIHRHAAAGAVTPRGHATIAAYRFLRELRALSPEDRQYVHELLAEELTPVA